MTKNVFLLFPACQNIKTILIIYNRSNLYLKLVGPDVFKKSWSFQTREWFVWVKFLTLWLYQITPVYVAVELPMRKKCDNDCIRIYFKLIWGNSSIRLRGLKVPFEENILNSIIMLWKDSGIDERGKMKEN